LVIVGVLLLEQPDGFLGGKLGDAGEVLYPKAV
jgi:hypothetical protein